MRSFILILIFTLVVPAKAQQSDFVTIDFSRADRLAEAQQGEDLYSLPMLVQNLTANLKTDVEKFRAIYYWVSHNIGGEYHLMIENNRMRKRLKDKPEELAVWNNGFKKEVFNKLLQDKETLCSGYTFLIKEMARLAGIECETIEGYAPIDDLDEEDLGVPNHSWNAVKLNDKWYLCDATWSSGLTDLSTFLFHFDYDDSYFLMDPTEFAKSHRPLDLNWTLLPQVAVIDTTTIKQ